MAVLTFLHARLAIALIAYAALLGLWGTLSLLGRNHAVSGGYRSSFLLMIALTAVQGALGAITLASGDRPREILHIVYGIFAIVFLPGAYFYSSRRKPDQEATILAVSAWIVAIAYGRGLSTG
jgi:heme A synthase